MLLASRKERRQRFWWTSDVVYNGRQVDVYVMSPGFGRRNSVAQQLKSKLYEVSNGKRVRRSASLTWIGSDTLSCGAGCGAGTAGSAAGSGAGELFPRIVVVDKTAG